MGDIGGGGNESDVTGVGGDETRSVGVVLCVRVFEEEGCSEGVS